MFKKTAMNFKSLIAIYNPFEIFFGIEKTLKTAHDADVFKNFFIEVTVKFHEFF